MADRAGRGEGAGLMCRCRDRTTGLGFGCWPPATSSVSLRSPVGILQARLLELKFRVSRRQDALTVLHVPPFCCVALDKAMYRSKGSMPGSAR